jgi:lipid-A-disaccharide synthase-like uncharacterized protein
MRKTLAGQDKRWWSRREPQSASLCGERISILRFYEALSNCYDGGNGTPIFSTFFSKGILLSSHLLPLLGYTGALLFYGRFYLQWFVSERQGKTVIPVGFWYMSGVGSLLLLLYGAFWLNSPVGTLSHCFNSLIYARNLVHIWQERGVLTPKRSFFFQGAVLVVISFGILLVFATWVSEYQNTRDESAAVQTLTWFWIGIGVAGQALFALRFLIQWAVTEIKRRSIVPASFWYLSLVASLLLMSSHIQRQEWIYGVGIATTMLVYLRNIYWIHTAPQSHNQNISHHRDTESTEAHGEESL